MHGSWLAVLAYREMVLHWGFEWEDNRVTQSLVRTVPIGAVCCFENMSNTSRADSSYKHDCASN
jgi:hypothetical protein